MEECLYRGNLERVIQLPLVSYTKSSVVTDISKLDSPTDGRVVIYHRKRLWSILDSGRQYRQSWYHFWGLLYGSSMYRKPKWPSSRVCWVSRIVIMRLRLRWVLLLLHHNPNWPATPVAHLSATRWTSNVHHSQTQVNARTTNLECIFADEILGSKPFFWPSLFAFRQRHADFRLPYLFYSV